MSKINSPMVVFSFLALVATNGSALAANNDEAQLGSRPADLVKDMDEGALKSKLQKCVAEGNFTRSSFSISHRGAPLHIAEHTKEGYQAAARMGAGLIECDVTFTSDEELVCRHSQCDLATTTDILSRPKLAAKCTKPGTGSEAKCCTSDITLAEFKSLNGNMDKARKNISTNWKSKLFPAGSTLMSHRESIDLIAKTGAKFIPELKRPSVKMPFKERFSQSDFMEKLISEYKAAGIDPSDVYIQSFDLKDIYYLIEHHPEFAKQAAWLDARYRSPLFNPDQPNTFKPSMKEFAKLGVRTIAPPMWMLISTDKAGKLVPSAYAKKAKEAGLEIIAWTLERSGSLTRGGGWYYKTSGGNIKKDGDVYKMIDILAKDVGVKGLFSDWPATVSLYANCMGLK